MALTEANSHGMRARVMSKSMPMVAMVPVEESITMSAWKHSEPVVSPAMGLTLIVHVAS